MGFFSTKTLKSGVFYTYSTSQCEHTTFQILKNHIWLVATILGNAVLDEYFSNFSTHRNSPENVKTQIPGLYYQR